MPPAASITHLNGHPGMISGPGCPNVLVGSLPIAVLGDLHVCAMPPLAGPHPPTPLILGSTSVLCGGRPAARLGDPSGCGSPTVLGHFTVLIGG